MNVFSQKKRQVVLALFLFVFCATGVAKTSPDNALCHAKGQLERAKVQRIVDGDTLYLSDGKRVRFIGINTPELDHKKGHHEPYAVAATQTLRALVGNYVYLQAGKEPRDHYGRYLFYVFDKDRISLSSQLLSKGLGYRIAIPPNVAYQSCFIQAEQTARKAGLGVWTQSLAWRPHSGFVVSQVVISSITKNRGGWWLATDHDLVIHLPLSSEDYWPAQKVYFLKGHNVEVRGWQHHRKSRSSRYKSWVLSVKHPNDLQDLGMPE
ncbi:Thermonuclease precursor [Marinomonas spartinae]|uniref:thermonuclease family protein n=1 Tax=Marinomonas spartinae TaxID=1792290 RepID=UPI000808FECB|nr:thermonuclease family protein [Marinomonas spartinae]SBS31259.1 Thermonuclease precursor [Marinomonas spartinae]